MLAVSFKGASLRKGKRPLIFLVRDKDEKTVYSIARHLATSSEKAYF